MASVAIQTQLTPEEYLTWERKTITKNEYLSGKIVAMSGASYQHTLITMNVSGELYIQLKGRECTVHTNDMRVNLEN
jgi:Uma2 family endonuclease